MRIIMAAAAAAILAGAALSGQALAAKSHAKAATASSGGKSNRMSECAAQWRDMKAQGKTDGMTYRQWSSQCMKKH